MHFPEITDSHLKHCCLMLLPDTENSKRKSDFIVKVPFCFQDMKFLGKNRCDHFLGTGLPHTSGNPDHRYRKLLSVILSNILKGLERILH